MRNSFYEVSKIWQKLLSFWRLLKNSRIITLLWQFFYEETTSLSEKEETALTYAPQEMPYSRIERNVKYSIVNNECIIDIDVIDIPVLTDGINKIKETYVKDIDYKIERYDGVFGEGEYQKIKFMPGIPDVDLYAPEVLVANPILDKYFNEGFLGLSLDEYRKYLPFFNKKHSKYVVEALWHIAKHGMTKFNLNAAIQILFGAKFAPYQCLIEDVTGNIPSGYDWWDEEPDAVMLSWCRVYKMIFEIPVTVTFGSMIIECTTNGQILGKEITKGCVLIRGNKIYHPDYEEYIEPGQYILKNYHAYRLGIKDSLIAVSDLKEAGLTTEAPTTQPPVTTTTFIPETTKEMTTPEPTTTSEELSTTEKPTTTEAPTTTPVTETTTTTKALIELWPPRLLFPDDNSTGNPIQPLFIWDTEPGASAYSIQISEDIAFSVIEHEQSNIIENFYDMEETEHELEYGKTYYWRAKSLGDGISYSDSEWGDPWQLTTMEEVVETTTEEPTTTPVATTTPEPTTTSAATTTTAPIPQLDMPILSLPEDGEIGVAVLPIFSWQPVANATSYNIRIYVTGELGMTLVNQTVSEVGYILMPDHISGKDHLDYGATYEWRVKAKAAGYEDSEFSELWSFTVMEEPTTTPVATTTGMPTTTLEATTTPTPLDPPSPVNMLEPGEKWEPVTTTTGLPTTTPLGTTTPTETTTTTEEISVLGIPNRNSPGDNATGISTLPKFTWDMVNNATGNGIEVFDDEHGGEGNLVAAATIMGEVDAYELKEEDVIGVDKLEYNRDYWWHMKALGDGENYMDSPFTDPLWNFRTETE